jgi:hypothetical protein
MGCGVVGRSLVEYPNLSWVPGWKETLFRIFGEKMFCPHVDMLIGNTWDVRSERRGEEE